MTYDFDGNEWDDERGSKWLKYKEEGSKDMPEFIDIDVVVPAVLKPKIVDGLVDELSSEMQENMRMYRGKLGLDTFFDDKTELVAQLDTFLDIQEMYLQLDPDFCPPDDRES